jgi:hypothetical protein
MGGVTRVGLAAIAAGAGRPTAWNPRFFTQALAVSGATLYAGYEGLAAINIHSGRTAWTRRLNPVTQEVTSGSIDVIATDGTTVYVGGHFVTVGGKSRNSLAAIDARTGRITSWHPKVSGPLQAGLGEVRALAVVGTTLYVGGEFDHAGGRPRANLAALDTKTGDAFAWNPGTNAEPFGVRILVARGSALYVGGDFTKVAGQPRRGVAAVDLRTGALRTWNPQLGGTPDVEVDAIALSSSAVYIGGVFGSVGSQARRNLAAVELSSAAPLPWSPTVGQLSPDFGVQALVVGPSTLFVGGGFESVGGFEQSFLAAFPSTG